MPNVKIPFIGNAGALDVGTDVGKVSTVPIPISSMDAAVNAVFATMTRTGSAALLLATDFASAAQGTLASTAMQPSGSTLQFFRGDGSLATIQSYLTSNQTITLSGDASGSGATAITVALAAVGTTGTYSGITTDTKGRVTSGTSRSFTNNASRSIQTVAAAANGWQLSSTRESQASYACSISTTATIGGAATGYIVLEICATNSATAANWQEIDRLQNSQTITLAIALQSLQVFGASLHGIIPAGWFVRLRSVQSSGTPTFAFSSGQEVLL